VVHKNMVNDVANNLRHHSLYNINDFFSDLDGSTSHTKSTKKPASKFTSSISTSSRVNYWDSTTVTRTVTTPTTTARKTSVVVPSSSATTTEAVTTVAVRPTTQRFSPYQIGDCSSSPCQVQ
jgi:hypothetical protein